MKTDWPKVQLHIVTGKGGTGKTTVAAALALALASRGKQVLLCEVEGRQGIAQLFDVPPLPYEERLIAQGPDDGGDVYALAIDAESAMLEYLQLYYRLGNRTGKMLDRFGVIDFATTIAPGLRDVLLTGKVFEAVERNSRNKGARVYDAVVLDAPPTGRISQFLNVNGEFGDLARVGAVKGQTERVMGLLKSRRTAVHLVSVLEDMPVQETIDGIADLRSHGLPVGGVVVNLTRPHELGDEALERALKGELPRDVVEKDLAAVDIEAGGGAGGRPARRGPCARRAPRARGRAAGADRGAGPAHLRAEPAAGRHRPRRPLRAGRRAARAGDVMSTRNNPRVGPLASHASAAPHLDVDALIDDERTGVIVCTGSGGVGKTTTSAALALRAAERGRKVVVLTIDPARRLAQSMGIEKLDNIPRPVPGLSPEPPAGAGRSTR